MNDNQKLMVLVGYLKGMFAKGDRFAIMDKEEVEKIIAELKILVDTDK